MEDVSQGLSRSPSDAEIYVRRRSMPSGPAAMWYVGTLCGADPGEVAGVAAVVAADHDHQIQRVAAQQRQHGVLPILGGAADRVEGPEVVAQPLDAVAIEHRAPELSPISQRLGHQHRRLIGEADALQIAVGIEAGRDARSEPRSRASRSPPFRM